MFLVRIKVLRLIRSRLVYLRMPSLFSWYSWLKKAFSKPKCPSFGFFGTVRLLGNSFLRKRFSPWFFSYVSCENKSASTYPFSACLFKDALFVFLVFMVKKSLFKTKVSLLWIFWHCATFGKFFFEEKVLTLVFSYVSCENKSASTYAVLGLFI